MLADVLVEDLDGALFRHVAVEVAARLVDDLHQRLVVAHADAGGLLQLELELLGHLQRADLLVDLAGAGGDAAASESDDYFG